MAEYVTKEQVIDWFSPYGHLDKPISFETLVSDLRGMKAADVKPVQEWISVKDRLPEEKVNCIVHYKHAYCDNDDYWAIRICFYDGEKFQLNPAYKVTHWMPLPQPPKGE